MTLFILQTLSEVKSAALLKFCINDIVDGARLRIDHDTLGLRSPCM